jgi:hypothetical protein
MGLKSGVVFNKGDDELGWRLLLKSGGRGSFLMDTFYKNLTQMPKYIGPRHLV